MTGTPGSLAIMLWALATLFLAVEGTNWIASSSKSSDTPPWRLHTSTGSNIEVGHRDVDLDGASLSFLDSSLTGDEIGQPSWHSSDCLTLYVFRFKSLILSLQPHSDLVICDFPLIRLNER